MLIYFVLAALTSCGSVTSQSVFSMSRSSSILSGGLDVDVTGSGFSTQLNPRAVIVMNYLWVHRYQILFSKPFVCRVLASLLPSEFGSSRTPTSKVPLQNFKRLNACLGETNLVHVHVCIHFVFLNLKFIKYAHMSSIFKSLFLLSEMTLLYAL